VDDGRYLRQSSLYKQILPRTPSRQIRPLPTYQVGPRNLRNLCPRYPRLKNSCLGAFVAINPFNQRNPRLINDLRLRKITYEIINLFLQNEPNFRKSQVNISDYMTRDYEQMDTWSSGKNEPKTNPNEPKTNPIVANKTPIRTQFKPKQTQPVVSLSNLFPLPPNLADLAGRW